MEIFGQIESVTYEPLLCKENMKQYDIFDLDKALKKESAFFLKMDEDNSFAVSCWVSAKRTRSYPYARVYNTLNYTGKRVTIIPIYKDEGKDGDRDYLQWDTISLMSLLDVHIIIAYYNRAEKSKKYDHKIAKQLFNSDEIREELKRLQTYHSSSMHWNIEQFDRIGDICQKAINSYNAIAEITKVEMHSEKDVTKWMDNIKKCKDDFMKLSRDNASKAQHRESNTTQPKENLNPDEKATITIINFLGGKYYFTADEATINDDIVNLVEAKHSKNSVLPSRDDIKDGLIKMYLFKNLNKVIVDEKEYDTKAILKLTSEKKVDLSKSQKKLYDLLIKEAEINNFEVMCEGIE